MQGPALAHPLGSRGTGIGATWSYARPVHARFVGLDVHKASITVAVAAPFGDPEDHGSIADDPQSVRRLMPRASGSRPEGRDAAKQARLLRSGDLVAVWMPGEAGEALRNLVRARDDARADQLRARRRLSRFLLCRGGASARGCPALQSAPTTRNPVSRTRESDRFPL
jgi:hypothetical protein